MDNLVVLHTGHALDLLGGPPRSPQVPEESAPAGARPHSITLRFEPDSLRAARPSCATQPQGGERSSGRRSTHPERAATRCGRCQGGRS
jgi:hypothetical protein